MGRKRVLERYNGLKLGWLHDSIFFVVAVAVIFVLFSTGVIKKKRKGGRP